ncbi:MAG: helix-turn-helix transcriptional regulator [Proteobacteria bacterium]|nr:helix-turn-helix transcriptional regulator [Pseudomonadota bacterium]
MLTGEQIRAARALARWGQVELAQAAGLSVETIKRLEKTHGVVQANLKTVTAIIRAFEGAGVVFELEKGAGPGARLLS